MLSVGYVKNWMVSCRPVCTIVCVVILATSAVAESPTDIVPRDSWTTDALVWLAGRGYLNGFSSGDIYIARTFTRSEVAVILQQSVNRAEAASNPAAVQIINALDAEYATQTTESDPQPAAAYNLKGIADYRYVDTPDRTIGVGEVSGFLSSPSLSVDAAVSNTHRLFFEGNHNPFPIIQRFTYRKRDREWSWEVGRTFEHIGIAFTGSLWLGQSSPALLQASAAKRFHLGRTFGWWNLDWQVGGYRQNGDNFYLVTKRASKQLSEMWSVELIDTVKTTLTPNPAMLIVPAQLYQAAFLNDIDSKWNTLMGIQAVYHPTQRWDLYGQLMVDDVSNPFDPGPETPKKTGLLFGARARVGSSNAIQTRVMAEYASLDTRTYEATRPSSPLLAWTQDGLPLAWPYGGNSKTLHLRAEHKWQRFGLIGSVLHSEIKTGPGRQTTITLQPSFDFADNASLYLILQKQDGDLNGEVYGIRAVVTY